jgi:hypothetical protein
MVQILVSLHGPEDVGGGSGGYVQLTGEDKKLHFDLVSEVPALIERLFEHRGVTVHHTVHYSMGNN